MKIFLDANILVSVLNKEFPLFTYSSRVVSLTENPKYTVYTSPLCLAIAYYFAEKKHGNNLARNKISMLIKHLNITTIGEKTIIDVEKNKKIHDFEDGLQYYSALEDGCKCIITEDKNGFYYSEIEVLSARKFMEKYIL